VRYYGRQGRWTLIRLRKGRGWVRSRLLGARRARVVESPRAERRRVRGLDIPVPRAERRGEGRLDIPVPRATPAAHGGGDAPAPDPAVEAIDVEPCKTPADCPATGDGAVVLPGGS